MANIEWKDLTYLRQPYRVSKEEFPTKTVYTAWEKADQSLSHKTKFMTERSHSRLYHEGRDAWGAINERRLPDGIEQMTPRSPERIEATLKLNDVLLQLCMQLISSAFNVEGGVPTKGQIVSVRGNPIEIKENRGARSVRSVVTSDRVKEMLAVTDMPNMQKLAKLNNVPLKDSDTAGLLKMRLANAFRKIIKDGREIQGV